MAAEVTVTIKGGGGYDEPWLVYRGTEQDVLQAVITSFGFTTDQVYGLPLVEVVRAATDHFKGVSAVAVGLGGKPMTPAQVEAEPAEYEVGDEGGDPWEGVTPAGQPDKDWPEVGGEAAEVDPNAALIAAINAAESLEVIQRLWAKNQSAFSEQSVQNAVKARRAALGA